MSTQYFGKTTGIGSLPHPSVDSAIQFSFRFGIPFLPQIPIRNPKETMIAQALEGLPGLQIDGNGNPSILKGLWESKTTELRLRMENAIAKWDFAFAEFEPNPAEWSCWNPFLFEIDSTKTKIAKIQIAGPLTCQWALRLEDNSPADRIPEIGSQVFQLILCRALAMIQAVKNAGAEPLLFVDEPGLYAFSDENPKHPAAFAELGLFLTTLRKTGAKIGLHCCSNPDWKRLLSLPVDFLSFDVQLSAPSLLAEKKSLEAYLERGARFAFGIVPTGTPPNEEPGKLLDTLVANLGTVALTQALWTPACGLALHSPASAEAILGQLEAVTHSLSRA